MGKRRKGRRKPSRLGDLLVAHGLITRDQRRTALARQKKTGRRLGETLVEQHALTRDELNWALGNLLGLPYVELDPAMVDAELLRAISPELLRRCHAVPMIQVGDEIIVAMADPTDGQAVADIAAATGATVRIAMADAEAIADTLDALAPDQPEPHEPEITIRRSRRRRPTRDQILADASGQALIQHHLREAVKQGADEILIEPSQASFRVRYRLHGALAESATYPISALTPAITRLKIMGQLDLEADVLFQEGQMALDVEGRALELLASVYTTVHGPGARLQLRAKQAEPWALEKLGLDRGALAALRGAVLAPAGLIVVCGPRRSGCTTTLYGLLAEAARADRRAITVQDFTSYACARATQIEVPRGAEYFGVVSSIAAQAPDVLLAEGLHESAFWQALGAQALTSTLLLGEMRAEDALSAVSQLRECGVGGAVLAASLRLIVAQRLAPRLDPKAREEATPPPQVLDRVAAAVPDASSGRYYRAKTDADGHRIFRGLELLYEVLEPHDELRDLIADGAPAARLREACERAGVVTLRECAVAKAARGLIELEEAL